jgi:hypothetical protein
MLSRRRGAIGGSVEQLRLEPRLVRREARGAPARRVEPRVEVLLQRAQVPALELPRPVRAVEEDAPGLVAAQLAQASARLLDAQREHEAGLAERPGPVAVPIEEDLGADHVPPRHEPARQVDRVGLVRARVARSRAPLHAAAVDEEAVAAVGAHEAARGRRRLRELQLAPEEHEAVRERALGGQPDPARGRHVDASPGLGQRPAAAGDANRRRLGRRGGRGPWRGRLRGCGLRLGRTLARRRLLAGLCGCRPRRRERGSHGGAEPAQEAAAALLALAACALGHAWRAV